MSELRRNLQINGETFNLAVSQYGDSSPTSSTPGKPGVLYLNTFNGNLYKCTAADPANNTYTWVAMVGAGGLFATTVNGEGAEEISVMALRISKPNAGYVLSIGDKLITKDNYLYEITALPVDLSSGYTAKLIRSLGNSQGETGSGLSPNGDGLTAELKTALINYYTHVMPIFDDTNGLAYVNAILTALGAETRGESGGDTGGGEEDPDEPVPPTVTLSSISVTYSGGDVAVGTAVSDLTGIVVTAHYSDGSSETVTGYTLSGTIAEGSNTVTVSYGGKSATFTVTGVAESGGDTEAALPTDGLVDYFDFRTVEYNNSGAGSSTTIAPTQGDGQLYTWANNAVTEQSEDYGVKTSRSMMYSSAGNTTQTECGTSFTWAFASYSLAKTSPFFSNDYAALSNVAKLSYKPKYNTSSSIAQVTAEALGTRVEANVYDYVVLTVSGSICKLYFGYELVKTVDGNDIDGFMSWYSKLMCMVLDGNANGYFTHLAVYNKALSDIEITELVAYLKGLEVA